LNIEDILRDTLHDTGYKVGFITHKCELPNIAESLESNLLLF